MSLRAILFRDDDGRQVDPEPSELEKLKKQLKERDEQIRRLHMMLDRVETERDDTRWDLEKLLEEEERGRKDRAPRNGTERRPLVVRCGGEQIHVRLGSDYWETSRDGSNYAPDWNEGFHSGDRSRYLYDHDVEDF